MTKRKETVRILRHSIGKPVSKSYKLNRPLSVIEMIRPKTPPKGFRPTQAELQRELDSVLNLRNKTRSLTRKRSRETKDIESRSESEALNSPMHSLRFIGDMRHAERQIAMYCRYREITIRECLKEICVNLEETLPINGNYEFIGSVEPKIENGDFPSFTFYPENYPDPPAEPWQKWDCAWNVDYDQGDINIGSLSIATACSITENSKIQGIGLNFNGLIRAQLNRLSDQPGEWAFASITSKLTIRALPPGGSLITIYEDPPYRLLEWNHTESAAFEEHTFLPMQRFIELDMDALPGYSFFIDYDLTYWLETSGGQSSACIGLCDFQIIPYIVYSKCGYEWVQIQDAIWDLGNSPHKMGKKD